MKNPFEDPTFVFATTLEDAGDGLKLLTFPDGFRCYTHSNEQEVMLIYNEIFVKHEYLGGSIVLEGCRYVFDVGANIGLFTRRTTRSSARSPPKFTAMACWRRSGLCWPATDLTSSPMGESRWPTRFMRS